MHDVGRRHRCPRLVRVPGALRRGAVTGERFLTIVF
jgi:hypothetical protein